MKGNKMTNETMSLTVKEIYAKFYELKSVADNVINEMIKLSDETGLVFSYRPNGLGTYFPTLTHKRVLELVESEEYGDLNYYDKDRAEQVLNKSGKDYEADDYDESCWQTSFC
jgi:hypothetical protein